jgi:hypothetical protein
MSATVCLSTNTSLSYPQGGGHLWIFLNWALGLRALGCEVIWLETVSSEESVAALNRRRGLEAAPIGGQLFAHNHSQRDCTAF